MDAARVNYAEAVRRAEATQHRSLPIFRSNLLERIEALLTRKKTTQD